MVNNGVNEIKIYTSSKDTFYKRERKKSGQQDYKLHAIYLEFPLSF